MSAAADAASLWYEASQEAGTSVAPYSQLRLVLRQSLGEEAKTAIAYLNDVPVVVALDRNRLICARPEDPADSDDAVILVDSYPLGSPCWVGMRVSMQEHHGGSYMVRTWTLGGPERLVLDTRSPVSQLHGSEYGGRGLLEKTVSRLGWPLTEPG